MTDASVERLVGLLEKVGGAAKDSWAELCRQVVVLGWAQLVGGLVSLALLLLLVRFVILSLKRAGAECPKKEDFDPPAFLVLSWVAAALAVLVLLLLALCGLVDGVGNICFPALRVIRLLR